MEPRFAAIGGLGAMLSPSAFHLERANYPARCVAVYDRGNPAREKERNNWLKHGAQLVSSIEELKKFELDFIVICAGKDGDDKQIFDQISELKFSDLVHLSTVSAAFANQADSYWQKKRTAYINCPLTGGPVGAEKGTMLILGSGRKEIFDRYLPFFNAIGTPKYFGESPSAGAEVKLIGQVMVFSSLLGLSTAINLHSSCFPGEDQTEFFDFLNNGAGGCRQWEVALRQGVANDNWSSGFDIRHAVVDAVYALRLLDAKESPEYLKSSIRTVIELFVLQLQEKPLATHSILNLLDKNPYSGLPLEEVLADLPKDVFNTIDSD